MQQERDGRISRRLVVGNWKMNGVAAQLGEVERIGEALRDVATPRVVICPPATLLHRCATILRGSAVEVGAQDLHADPPGARTGDLAAEMLVDAGARWVILGHSERRDRHRETDALVSLKFQGARRAGLRPIVCVGETAQQRADGRQRAVVRAQVLGSCPDSFGDGEFAVAYEPVWAIGSGSIPTVQQIAEIHAEIAEALHERVAAADDVAILYGGSVTAANAPEILAAPGVGGLLIGGASLRADAFLPIVAAAT